MENSYLSIIVQWGIIDISQYDLINKYNVDKAVLQRLRDNHNVHLNTIDKLCNILHCDIEDIIEHK